MATNINNGMCRCCASEGTYKHLSSEYQWMGETEVYADMLRDCFDINISMNEDGNDGGICEVCITQLRNAANFKKQVLHTEERFKNRLASGLLKNSIIKVEVNALEYDNNSEDNNLSEDFSTSEYMVPIKSESDEGKSKKRTRATTSRAKKPKVEEAESSTKKIRGAHGTGDTTDKIVLNKRLNFSTFIVINPTIVDEETEKTPETISNTNAPKEPSPKVPTPASSPELPSPKPVKKPSLKPIKKAPGRPIKKQVIKPVIRRFNRPKPQAQKALQRRLTELDLHYDNIKTVLRCSNATPIRCKTDSGYSCSYCSEEFVEPKVLKSHTLLKHTDSNHKPECLAVRSLSKYCVHLDITDLMCNICETSFENLEDLVDHLKYYHDELIHSNIRNLMVPYKFPTADVCCAVCAKKFDDYVALQDHMSEHYKNYVCEFCDKAFLLRCTMMDHKKVVHQV